MSFDETGPASLERGAMRSVLDDVTRDFLGLAEQPI
jgi:hypothetical protein